MSGSYQSEPEKEFNKREIENGTQAFLDQDYRTALNTLRPLALLGNKEAQFLIGLMYDSGSGVDQDIDEAMKWFEKAATQGEARAQNHLGDFHKKQGNGDEAEKWYRRAVEQGHEIALTNLVRLYCMLPSIPEGDKEVFGWFQKLAEQGDPNAQFHLGLAYEHGRDVPQSYKEAEKWYMKAAAQTGNTIATLLDSATERLAHMYVIDEVPLGNPEEVVKWCRESADWANNTNRGYMGRMYEKGKGVPQDYVQAYMWHSLALYSNYALPQSVTQFNQEALDELEIKMTPPQTEEAKRLEEEWKLKHKKKVEELQNKIENAGKSSTGCLVIVVVGVIAATTMLFA